jgi:hypothetical protein
MELGQVGIGNYCRRNNGQERIRNKKYSNLGKEGGGSVRDTEQSPSLDKGPPLAPPPPPRISLALLTIFSTVIQGCVPNWEPGPNFYLVCTLITSVQPW